MTSTIPAGTNRGERVLVVDDEPDIVALVVYHLAKAGYRVSSASSGPGALDAARREEPALIVLDLMLPGCSGFDVLEELRADPETRDIAVLMLTARKDEPDRIRGLSLGADDYITKPFSPPELVLRVGAILRRVGAAQPGANGEMLRAGPLELDRAAHRVRVEGVEVELTPTEFKLLLTLMERRGRVAGAGPPAGDGVGSRARHPDPDGGHARATPAHEARRRGPVDRDGTRIRLSDEGPAGARRVRLRSRLVAGALAVIAVQVLVVVALVERQLSSSLRSDAVEGLAREARVVAAHWTAGVDPLVLAHTDGAALGHRVTLIRSDGVVVGDADFDQEGLQTLENHATRPEVIAARAGATGISARRSPSRGDMELYVAVAASNGVARVSMSEYSLESAISNAYTVLLIAGAMSLLVALIVAWSLADRLARPIVGLTEVAGAIAQGDLTRRASIASPGELGELALSLRDLSEQLAARDQARLAYEALLEQLTESLNEGVIGVGAARRVVRINETGRRLLGVRDALPFSIDLIPRDRVLREALEAAFAGQDHRGERDRDPRPQRQRDRTSPQFRGRRAGPARPHAGTTAGNGTPRLRRERVARIAHAVDHRERLRRNARAE